MPNKVIENKTLYFDGKCMQTENKAVALEHIPMKWTRDDGVRVSRCVCIIMRYQIKWCKTFSITYFVWTLRNYDLNSILKINSSHWAAKYYNIMSWICHATFSSLEFQPCSIGSGYNTSVFTLPLYGKATIT